MVDPRRDPACLDLALAHRNTGFDKHTMSSCWFGGFLLHRNWCSLVPQVCMTVEDGMLRFCSVWCICATFDTIYHGKQKRRIHGASVQSERTEKLPFSGLLSPTGSVQPGVCRATELVGGRAGGERGKRGRLILGTGFLNCGAWGPWSLMGKLQLETQGRANFAPAPEVVWR